MKVDEQKYDLLPITSTQLIWNATERCIINPYNRIQHYPCTLGRSHFTSIHPSNCPHPFVPVHSPIHPAAHPSIRIPSGDATSPKNIGATGRTNRTRFIFYATTHEREDERFDSRIVCVCVCVSRQYIRALSRHLHRNHNHTECPETTAIIRLLLFVTHLTHSMGRNRFIQIVRAWPSFVMDWDDYYAVAYCLGNFLKLRFMCTQFCTPALGVGRSYCNIVLIGFINVGEYGKNAIIKRTALWTCSESGRQRGFDSAVSRCNGNSRNIIHYDYAICVGLVEPRAMKITYARKSGKSFTTPPTILARFRACECVFGKRKHKATRVRPNVAL